jgi:hypothetical protein
LKIKNMLESDSYFGYTDIIYYSNSIITICKNHIKERKKDLLEHLSQLKDRVERHMAFVKRYHYPRLINSCRKQLAQAGKEIDQILNNMKFLPEEQITEIEAFSEELSTELNNLELNLKKLDIIQQFLINISMFVKKSAVFLSIVLLIGIFAVPVIMPAVARIDSTESNSVWFYQKTFLIIGTIASIGISLLLTIKKIIRDD